MANPSRNTVFDLIILCGAISAAAPQQTGTQPAQKEQSSAATAGAAADLANGKAVYTKSCQKCHAADGKGNPSIARMQKVNLRPLGSPEILAKSDAELIKQSTQGAGKMKAVQLSDKDAQDVVAYLRTFKEEKK
jgi:mono/diheme cytochrome c family protein